MAQRFRALLGIPRPQERAIPAWVTGGVVVTLLAGFWGLSIAAGGTESVSPHWFYIPIAVAAARFGYWGGGLTGLLAGVVAGPLAPLRTGAGTAQPLADWGSRAAFFVVIGMFLAWLVDLYKTTTVELRSSRQVTRALMGTMEPPKQNGNPDRELIQHALAPGSLTVALQPIFRLQTGRPVGYESLARFGLHPPRPPNEWFADAWAVGLGVELEMAALESSLSTLNEIPDGYLSINLSPATLLAPRFRRSIPSLPTGRLILEMTEHVPVSDYETLAACIGELRAHGIRFAVDDAGAGYSSLRHVIRLAPDVIKLDIALVHGIDSNPLLRTVAKALIGFGAESGAQIVAEGIETEAELRTLRALGTEYGQGFYLSPPRMAIDLPHAARTA